MRVVPKMAWIVIVTANLTALGALCASPQRQSVADLFLKFQSFRTTNQVAPRLRDLGKSNAAAREYLAAHLPELIEVGPAHYHTSSRPDAAWHFPDPIWLNAVTLAKDLNLVEAAPALAKWITISTTQMGTLYSSIDLGDNPAGTALVHIGDPAVPALQVVLERGTVDQRWKAANALNLIGSARAKAALRDHAPQETDKSLRDFIDKAVNSR